MVPDGATGPLAEKIAAYNAAHPDDQITRYSGAGDVSAFLWGDWSKERMPREMKEHLEGAYPGAFF